MIGMMSGNEIQKQVYKEKFKPDTYTLHNLTVLNAYLAGQSKTE